MSTYRMKSPQLSLADIFALVAISATAFWLYTRAHPFGPLYAWLVVAAIVWLAGQRLEYPPCRIFAYAMITFGLLAIPSFAIDGHCVPPDRLKLLAEGDTMEEVTSAIGDPLEVSSAGDGKEWLYGGSTWCHVRIFFDQSGLVKRIEHDH